MTNSAQQWLASRAAPPGMLACGMRKPDRNLLCHSLEDICPTHTMEKILRAYDGLRGAVVTDTLKPRWTTWVFEQGQMRFVERRDGWVLGLVIRTDSDALPRLDPLSMEFLALDLEA